MFEGRLLFMTIGLDAICQSSLKRNSPECGGFFGMGGSFALLVARALRLNLSRHPD
jgi:hypothetical protein